MVFKRTQCSVLKKLIQFLIIFQNTRFADEVLDCLENGKNGPQYSEKIRQFSIALSFYSPRAYRYLRSVFHNHLPELHTIQRWMKSIDGGPGISVEALNVLSAKVKEYESNGKPLLLAMISDEMHIAKKVGYDAKTNKFSGFVTCNNDENKKQEKLEVATNALVFMVAGENFKLPVGYFFLAGLNAQTRAALTQMVIEHVNETGAKVISLTGDGLIANISMVKELGADFDHDQPYFPSPTNSEEKIYVIWDPPHMLKLARGCLKTHQLYHENIPLQWNFIESLHNIQKQRNFNLGNKLTQMHLDFHVRPMNVRIAAQTVSHSVAQCIDQLREDDYAEFQNSEKTTEFIRHIKNTFNILNFKSNMSKIGENFR